MSDSIGVDSYAVEVSKSTAFTAIAFTDTVDQANTADTVTGLYNDTYYWRVRAIDDLGNGGPYASTRGFVADTIVNQVSASQPADAHETTAIDFQVSWSAVSDSVGVDSYAVEVSKNTSFTNVTFTDTVDQANTLDTVTGLYNDTYNWRVRAIDDLGNGGAFSTTRGFLTDTIVSQVTLSQPADGHETNVINFLVSWAAVGTDSVGIDSYAVEVSKSTAFTSIIFSDTVDGLRSDDTVTSLYNDTYFWRMRALDDLGNSGQYSSSRGFVTDTIVNQVSLSQPADGHETTAIDFQVSWSAVSDSIGVDSYAVEVSKNTSFTNITFTDTIDQAFTADTVTGLYNDTYYWRVRAIDDLANGGSYSATRGFVTDTRVNQASLSQPADGHETTAINILVSWSAVSDSVGVDSYAVEVSKNTAFTNITFTDTLDQANTSDTVTGLYNDTYYWRLRAIDDLANGGSYSATRGFVTDTLVNQVTVSLPADGHETTNLKPVARWSAVSDSVSVDSYVVEVSKLLTFETTVLVDTVDGALTQDTLSTLPDPDTYYWRVRAIDDLANKGPYSDTRGFALVTPATLLIFEDATFTDVVDTLLTRDLIFVEVSDTDESRNESAVETVTVTAYVADDAAGLVIDTQTLILTETSNSSGIFRSGAILVTDTVIPALSDGILSWGRSDTLHVTYTDANCSVDSSYDTALALEIATSARVIFYEDTAYGDEVDTYLTRDLMYVAVHDTDENRNPQSLDTVQATVYVGNGYAEGTGSAGVSAQGLVLDTQTLVLTESGKATGVFQSDTITLTDTEVPVTENGRLSWGRQDTAQVTYTDVTGTSETSTDTALALEITTTLAIQLFENQALTDDVDTYQTRDLLFVMVSDTDENRNPQMKDTVSVIVYVGNGTAGNGAAGLVIDTETLTLTESAETSAIFQSDTVVTTDTKVPTVNDGVLSWGLSDTMHLVYTDVTGTSETGNDTALALEIKTTAAVQFYEDAAYTDDVDTFQVRNDVVYVVVYDTDENKNPQSPAETVTVTVYVGDASCEAGTAIGLVLDTETLVLTESGETTGIFRSAAIAIVDTEFPLVAANGRLAAGLNDTIHVTYTDSNDATDARSDTALLVDAATASVTQIFEEAGFTDEVDTLLSRDVMFVQVTDTDENCDPQDRDTVQVTVFVGNGYAEGSSAQGLVIDTETLTLTETGETSGVFRSDTIVVTDTKAPVVNDGVVSWGRNDTLTVRYGDKNGSDTTTDTALALEIATAARAVLYEDAAFGDEVDTYQTRDVLYVAVHDTDENRNPQSKDTVSVTVYIGNGSVEGSDTQALVLDTQTLVLTESGETTGVFQSAAIALTDTEKPAVENGMVSWGRSDTLHIVYTDVTGTSETTTDTALALEIAATARVIFYEDAAYGDEVDTYQTRDIMYVAVHDTDENRNPQYKDTVQATVYVGNGYAEGSYAQGLVLDTQTLVLTESGETTGVFQSAAIALTDTEVPVTENTRLSWGRSDTMHATYTDVTGTSETTNDTALALEIATASVVQLYEDSDYTDAVDTYLVRNDAMFIWLADTDENRNPQMIDTVSVTIYAGDDASALVTDTEIIVMTETTETSGIFRFSGLTVADTGVSTSQNGSLNWGTSDTAHVSYTDVTGGTSDAASDTALSIAVPTQSVVQVYEDALYTDDVDTYLTRDILYVALYDTDENQNPQSVETVTVTVYVGNGYTEGSTAQGLIIDTETLTLTEATDTPGVFRSGAVVLTDTTKPVVSDGVVSWGRADTLTVKYLDNDDATDTSADTALAIEIASTVALQLFEDNGYADGVDTYLTRDVMHLWAQDTDENRNPSLKDTIAVTVYVGNGAAEGASAAGLVLDTEVLTLTETTETSSIFVSDTVNLTDTKLPGVSDGVISWGRSDTLHVTYTDVTGTSESANDTALAIESATSARAIFYEDPAYGDEVDTYLTRDVMYVAVHDTDENRNPQLKDTVQVTVYAGNGYAEGGYAQGLVLDTQTLVLTESGETTGIFWSDTVVLTDTLTPAVENNRLSWGRQDTLFVTYTDVTGTSETANDTALALEIATTARAVLYEDGAYGDEVDTYLTRDVMYVAVHDTDENRNPQFKDTVQVTVYVGNGYAEGSYAQGLVLDTQTLVLTESGETTGVFWSDTLVLTDTRTPAVEDNRLSWGRSDTLQVAYSDVTGSSESATDTALALEIASALTLQIYENEGNTDDVDTYLTRDVMHVWVMDTDENRNPQMRDTVQVTVYVGNSYSEGGYAQGLVLDTDAITLTESSETSGIFRSDTVNLTDTKWPVVNDGVVSWGRADTLHVLYSDVTGTSESGNDTALALEIATTARAVLYEDAAYGDEVDTYFTRDFLYVAVHDTDENRNPQAKDTVQVVVYIGNGTAEGTASSGIEAAALVIDTQTLVLTESGETTGIFQSGAIPLTDTEKPVVENSRLSWGRSDTLHLVYTDVTGTSETTNDTALALETGTAMTIQLYEDANFTDDVDTYLKRDVMYIQVQDTDENRNPQVKDTVSAIVRVGNDTDGSFIDTETIVLTETSETSGIFRSAAINLTDTTSPVVGDGVVSWGLSDTTHVVYVDASDGADQGFDTALAIDIPTPSRVLFYEDAGYGDEVDTFYTRDFLYLAVHDTDENRSPQGVDTVTVTMVVGNDRDGLVLDTETLILTESGSTTGIFRSDTINLTDTKVPAVNDGIVSWGVSDTLFVKYTDANDASDSATDTALALEIASAVSMQLYENHGNTDDVDTYLTRDVMHVWLMDTDENRNPQSRDTVTVTVHVGNGVAEGGAGQGLVIDTETLTMTETAETSGIFVSDTVNLTDTKVPAANDGVVSWGRSDTLQVVYTDVSGTSESANDTALAIEIPSTAALQLFDDLALTDPVDTYLTIDAMYVMVQDTDENRNPELRDTVYVTAYIGNGSSVGGGAALVLDTMTIVLTESAETSGLFRSDTLTLTNVVVPSTSDSVLSWGEIDTLHVVYVDALGTSESAGDTALAIEDPKTSTVEIYEELTFTDVVDTLFTRDVLFIQVTDTDENRNPQSTDTVSVTIYVGNGYAEGASAQGLVLDTATWVLTEVSTAASTFRSDTIPLSDTVVPSASDGFLSWGRADTLHVTYTDATAATDASYDTALALEIAQTARVILYEDSAFSDDVDTYLTRDLMFVAVHDTDENRNPQQKDTVSVTVYVGNNYEGLVLDTETLVLTESGETTGVFLSDTVTLTDTEQPSAENSRISWGRSDTLYAGYTDVTGTSETATDTALALEIASTAALQLFEDANYTDDVDTYLTRDAMYVWMMDTDENRNPQSKDTVTVTVYVANATYGGGAAALVIDTETLTLTESGETTAIFRSGSLTVTDTKVPSVNDGVLSWGASDTLHVAYTDATGTSEERSDTALAVEIATAAAVYFYEDSGYTDIVDTYLMRNDLAYLVVYDTDENRNPQAIETVTVTVHVGDTTGLVRDTETFVLTESGETTGIFRSVAVNLVDSDATSPASNGRLEVRKADTLHMAYTDSNAGTDIAYDTALVKWVTNVTLVSPANGHETTNAKPVVRWSGDADSVLVDSFVVEVSKVSTFASTVLVDTVDGTLEQDSLASLPDNDTYYWRVRAIDYLGIVGSYSAETRWFTIDTNVNQVNLSLPADGHETSAASFLLSWTAVIDSVGVDSYAVEVSKNTAFTNIAFTDTLDAALTNDTVTGLYNDTYYWRVRAIDNLANGGAYAATRGFVSDTLVGKVSLVTPVEAFETASIVLVVTWTGLSDSVGIDSYALEVSRNSAFTNMTIQDTIDGSLTTFTCTNLIADTYHWRVRAVDDLGNNGAYSDSRYFITDTSVQPVTFLLPADGHETNASPFTLTWAANSDSSGIDSYAVEVSKNTLFTDIVFTDTIDGSFTTDTISGLYNDTYYWRVRAMDNFQNPGPFAAIWGFIMDTNVNQISTVLPAAGHETTATSVVMSWTAITDSVGVDSYAVEVSKNSAFTNMVFTDTVDAALTTDTVTGLYNDTYFWHVRGVDDLGNTGLYSTTIGFVTDTIVDSVTLSLPADGHETSVIDFLVSWISAGADSVGFDSFALEVSKSTAFTSVVFTDTLDGAFTSDTVTGLYNDTYYWRMRGVDDLANAGPYSAIRGFVTDTIVAQVSASQPADAHETSAINFLVSWTAVTDSVGVDSYAVEVSKNSDFTNIAFTDTVDQANTSDTVTGLYNDTHFWRVRAIDDLGNGGAFSTTRGFVTDTIVNQVSASQPADGHETTAISLVVSWSAISDSVGVDSYALEVSTNATFTALAFTDTVDQAILSDTVTGLYNDTYYWRVRAIDDLANGGAYSTTRGFVTDTLIAQVSLSQPADAHETSAVNFLVSWQTLSDSVGIDSYALEVSKNTAFTNIAFTDTVDGALTSDTVTGLYNDTYYWRVRAIDDLANAGAFSSTRGFVADTIVAQVSASLPADAHETNAINFLVSWSAVTDSVGVDSYAVEASKNTAFTNIAFTDTVDQANTSDTVTGLYNDTYYWRVRAIDDLANAGTYSSTRGFVTDTLVDTLTLSLPADAHETSAINLVVSWSAGADSVGVDSYAVEVSKNSAFTNIAFTDTVDQANTSDTVTGLYNDTYYWRVRAIDDLANGGAFSTARGFVTDTIVNHVSLSLPADGHETTSNSVVVSWSANADSVGIDSYAVEVSLSTAFTSMAFTDTVDQALTSDTVTGLYNDTYYWRVRAIDDLANGGAYSSTRGFVTDTLVNAVALSLPADGHETSAANFLASWSMNADSSGIDSYAVEVSKNTAFTSIAFTDTIDGGQTSDTLTGLYNDTYYWRVRAIDNRGNFGVYATTRGFVHDSNVNKVSLSGPSTGSSTNDSRLTLAWSAITDTVGVDSYVLELSKSPDFSSIFSTDTFDATVTSDSSETGLISDTYYWRVRAVDYLRNAGLNSDTFQFLIDTTPITTTIVSPADAHETSARRPVFLWTSNAETFTLQIARDSAFTNIFSSTTAVNVSVLQPDTNLTIEDTHYWRLISRNRAGTFDTTSARGFLLDTTVRQVTLVAPVYDTITPDTTPTFYWSAIADSVGIDSYVLEISSADTFGPIVYVDTVDGTVTVDTVTPGLVADTYWWRIRAIDDLGNIGPNSDSRTIGIDTGSPFQAVGSVNIISGNHQLAEVQQTLTLPFRVRVLDTTVLTLPVPNSPVRFVISRPSGGDGYFGIAGITSKTAFTDSDGYASETLTLGTKGGVYEIQAISDSRPSLYAIFLAYADGIEITASKWRMISPNKVTLSATTVDASIKDDLSDALVYWWNESTTEDPTFSKYVKPTTISRGTGYWVYSKTGGKLVTQGTAGFDTLTYALTTAWNMIGTGHYFFVDWDSSVRFQTATSGALTPTEAASAGLIENAVYWYNGNGYSWGPDARTTTLTRIQLKPMVGFALYVLQSCSMVIYPNPATPLDTSTEIYDQSPKFNAALYQDPSEQDWAVRVVAHRGAIQDVQNYIGVKATPDEARLSARREPPPVALEYLSVAFEDAQGVQRSASFVDPITTANVWTVKLATDLQGPVLVSFDGVAGVPKKYDAYLVGGPQGPMNLREQTTVLMSDVGTLRAPSQYSVIVGLPEFLLPYLSAPLAKDQSFVYPNPGPDPNTGFMTFKYNLGAAAPVTIRIFDVAGRLVKQVEALGMPGSNKTVWDTTDRFGQRVGSGVYIYMINSSGTKLVDKLAIVR